MENDLKNLSRSGRKKEIPSIKPNIWKNSLMLKCLDRQQAILSLVRKCIVIFFIGKIFELHDEYNSEISLCT